MKSDGCLGQTFKTGIGCLLLAAACAVCPLLLFRGGFFGLDLFTSATAIDVSGECAAEAVETHFSEDGLVKILSALEDADDGYGDTDYSKVDLGRMLADRDELAALEVPPCLERVVEEELELSDTLIAGIDTIQSNDPGVITSVRAAKIVFDIVIHTRRVIDAKNELVEQTGARIDETQHRR